MNEKIEHKIIIDEYMTASIHIPKILTAIELKGLMMKASKLFNISQIVSVKDNTKKKKSHCFGNKRGRPTTFTSEMDKSLIYYREISKYSFLNISQKLNKKYDTNKSKRTFRDRYKHLKLSAKQK